jgi:hypothetical protein
VEKMRPGDDWKIMSLDREKLEAIKLDYEVLKAEYHQEEEEELTIKYNTIE